MSKNILTVKDVSYGYSFNKILDGVSLQIDEGDFACITGANGTGKTTLLNLLIGDYAVDGGDIYWYGEKINKFKDWKFIGYHPQIKQFNQGFPATVYEVVSLGLYSKQKNSRYNTKTCKEKITNALTQTDMLSCINKQIGCLSGGEQQRVLLSKLLAAGPKVFILDEPTVGIDRESKEQILKLLRKLNKEKKATVIIVTHDMSGIDLSSDKIFQLIGGKIKLITQVAEDI